MEHLAGRGTGVNGLDAAIREWLRPVPTVDRFGGWMHDTRAALIAVLDKHADETIGDGPAHCTECSSLAGVRVWAPCGTVRAIAKELGIEADHG